ncbi:cytochrome P450 family protein [Lentithecium fluviatile CBS 122367]|uniref:Cytochrome P450 family protein n=1 Tax=Lentithecium fluviatile CBS 122367 TaxID=1168545 RepID=A0A6G1IFD5_9PLEO|nr:cytochrome P450 family protein [Lentithecium fluviatile CBS 122367]
MPFMAFENFGSFMLVGILCAILYFIGVVVYRLKFHPLAKYPGPLLGKITDWYSVIRSLRGDRHIHFLRLHEKHGTFVRFGPNRISVNTAEGLQKIYGTKANTNKSNYYNVFDEVFKGDSSLTTIDNQLHAKKKRTVSVALSESSIRSMEELILRNIRSFCESLGQKTSGSAASTPDGEDRWSEPRDLTDWADYLAFDIMSDICFSSSFNMLHSTGNRYILEMLPKGVNGLNVCGWMPALLRFGIGDWFYPGLSKNLQRYEAFARQQSTKRLALGNDTGHHDVFSHLLLANKNSKSGAPVFSPSDLVAETSLLITGGSDTTATAIASTLFYLMHYPKALARLQAEVRPRFSSLESIRPGTNLSTCRWLRACIDEAMRITPGVPGLLPRRVLAEGVTIAGEWFAPGTDLGVPHYAIHHNEALYPDSFAYRPERWIIGCSSDSADGHVTSAEEVAKAESGFCAFSIGQRGCVGKALAMKELMVTIARLVWLYDMRLAPGEEKVGGGGRGEERGREREHELQIKDMFVAKTKGPVMQFQRRQKTVD